jgi:tRNA (guanine37-N1)-methyltransferase
MAKLQIYILTIFPDFFISPLKTSILQRARQQDVEYHIINIRDFAHDKHRVTDDRPFGGGPGMVMKVEPIDLALQHVRGQLPEATRLKVILTSAKGVQFTQSTAKSYAAELEALVIICGHYEGVDERVAQHLVDEEVRIGDYVLTGGEAAALVITDAVVRLIPGVLGNPASGELESHSEPGSLGFPQYTRPMTYKDWSVPEILSSGDHQAVKKWRQKQSREKSE